MRAALTWVAPLAWSCSCAFAAGTDDVCLVQAFVRRHSAGDSPQDLRQDLPLDAPEMWTPAVLPEEEEGIEPPQRKGVSQTMHFGSVPVYGYKRRQVDAETTGNGRQEWMMMFPPTYTTKQLEEVCEKVAAKNASCDYVGHPDEHGLPVLNINAPEPDMRASAVLCPEARYIEVSGPTKKLPFGVNMDPDTPYPLREVPWGLDRIDQRLGLDGEYKPFSGGRGAHIFHLDTGISVTSDEFGGRALPRLDMTKTTSDGLKYTECEDTNIHCAADRDGHGTHTAGTIASKKYGVAKEATIHAVKVLGDNGAGSWAWFIGALDWVMYWTHKHSVKPAIIAASLGGSGRLQIVKEAIEKATDSGFTVVVAAGNENMNACFYSPAYVPSAITVGSVDHNDKRSTFSNYGPCIDVFAPGSGIVSLSYIEGVDGTSVMSGTSMSAPHVAGAAALYIMMQPNVSIQSNVQTNLAAAVQMHMKNSATQKILHGMLPHAPQNRLLYVGSLDEPQPEPLPPLPYPSMPYGSPYMWAPPPPMWDPNMADQTGGVPYVVPAMPGGMPMVPGGAPMMPGGVPGGMPTMPMMPGGGMPSNVSMQQPQNGDWARPTNLPIIAEMDPAGPQQVEGPESNDLPPYPLQQPEGSYAVPPPVPSIGQQPTDAVPAAPNWIPDEGVPGAPSMTPPSTTAAAATESPPAEPAAPSWIPNEVPESPGAPAAPGSTPPGTTEAAAVQSSPAPVAPSWIPDEVPESTGVPAAPSASPPSTTAPKMRQKSFKRWWSWWR